MKRDKIIVNDRQLACARIASVEGQDYLKGMAAAGNYAWVNRSSMTFLTRQVQWGSPGDSGLNAFSYGMGNFVSTQSTRAGCWILSSSAAYQTWGGRGDKLVPRACREQQEEGPSVQIPKVGQVV